MPLCSLFRANGTDAQEHRFSGLAESAAAFVSEGNRIEADMLDALSRHGYSEDEMFSLVVPKRTLARRKAANEPLTVEETDKALRLERIAVQAERVFGEPEKAHRWLRKAKRELQRRDAARVSGKRSRRARGRGNAGPYRAWHLCLIDAALADFQSCRAYQAMAGCTRRAAGTPADGAWSISPIIQPRRLSK